jgi:hypothetical protein
VQEHFSKLEFGSKERKEQQAVLDSLVAEEMQLNELSKQRQEDGHPRTEVQGGMGKRGPNSSSPLTMEGQQPTQRMQHCPIRGESMSGLVKHTILFFFFLNFI